MIGGQVFNKNKRKRLQEKLILWRWNRRQFPVCGTSISSTTNTTTKRIVFSNSYHTCWKAVLPESCTKRIWSLFPAPPVPTAHSSLPKDKWNQSRQKLKLYHSHPLAYWWQVWQQVWIWLERELEPVPPVRHNARLWSRNAKQIRHSGNRNKLSIKTFAR